MITGYASIDGTKEALRLGAVDYIPKPFTPAQLQRAVEKALTSGEAAPGSSAGKGIVYRSRAMAVVLELVRQVAATGSTALMPGERHRQGPESPPSPPPEQEGGMPS